MSIVEGVALRFIVERSSGRRHLLRSDAARHRNPPQDGGDVGEPLATHSGAAGPKLCVALVGSHLPRVRHTADAGGGILVDDDPRARGIAGSPASESAAPRRKDMFTSTVLASVVASATLIASVALLVALES